MITISDPPVPNYRGGPIQMGRITLDDLLVLKTVYSGGRFRE